MSIAERLADRPFRDGCRVQEILSSVSPQDFDALYAALFERKWSNQALASLLKSEGFYVGRTTIGLHRNGECSCVKPDREAGCTS